MYTSNNIGCVLCAPFLKEIIEILIWPFDVAIDRYNYSLIANGAEEIKLDLIATHPMETFFVKLKIALFGGIVLSFPILAYQLYRFIAPGLYRNERKAVLPYLVISPFLFFSRCFSCFLLYLSICYGVCFKSTDFK